MEKLSNYAHVECLTDGDTFVRQRKTHAKIVPKRWAVIAGVFLKFWGRVNNNELVT